MGQKYYGSDKSNHPSDDTETLLNKIYQYVEHLNGLIDGISEKLSNNDIRKHEKLLEQIMTTLDNNLEQFKKIP